MKKRRILQILAALTMSAVAMTSCFSLAACKKDDPGKTDNPPEQVQPGDNDGEGETPGEHQHTYGSEYGKNDTHHWLLPTCGHEVDPEDCEGYAEHEFMGGVCECGAREPEAAPTEGYYVDLPAKEGYTTLFQDDFNTSETIAAFSDEWGTKGYYQSASGEGGEVNIKDGKVIATDPGDNNEVKYYVDFGTVTGVVEGYFELSFNNAKSSWTPVQFMGTSEIDTTKNEVVGLRLTSATALQYRLNTGDPAGTSVTISGNAIKVYFKFNLVTGKVTLEVESGSSKVKILDEYNNQISAIKGLCIVSINSGSSTADVDNLVVVNQTEENYMESLSAAKTAAKTELNNYRSSEEFTEDNQTTLDGYKSAGCTAIDAAKEQSEIDSALASAKAQCDLVPNKSQTPVDVAIKYIYEENSTDVGTISSIVGNTLTEESIKELVTSLPEGYKLSGIYYSDSELQNAIDFDEYTVPAEDAVIYVGIKVDLGDQGVYTYTVSDSEAVATTGEGSEGYAEAILTAGTSYNSGDFKFAANTETLKLTFNVIAGQTVTLKITGYTGSTGNASGIAVAYTGVTLTSDTANVPFPADSKSTNQTTGTITFTADTAGEVVLTLTRTDGKTARVTELVLTVGDVSADTDADVDAGEDAE